MHVVSIEKLHELQSNPKNVRNICILAHVDHGKTTLSDALLAANSIISAKSSGKVRYLDSRDDEQERGITMKSSGVALYFKVLKSHKEELFDEFLVNLIDSPGHVDFSSEVSSATRASDGALCIVDVIEGVCTQTHTVLRQAWNERLHVVLVLNKLDRLILEMQTSSMDAYTHLKRLIEQVNAIMGSFYREEQAERELSEDQNPEELFFKEEDIYFDPNKGNVIFSSAIDGWAFRPAQFASLYTERLGLSESELKKTLWGDFCFDAKSKKIAPLASCKTGVKPTFVQLVLDNIWAAYDSIIAKPDFDKLSKIVNMLNVKISVRELKSKDTRSVLQTVFSQWLPISRAVLAGIIDQLPSPVSAQEFRLPRLLKVNPAVFSQENAQLANSLFKCQSGADSPVTAYVVKVFDIAASHIQDAGLSAYLPENQKSCLLGFTRVFSGSLKTGDDLYVLDARHRGSVVPGRQYAQIHITRLFLLMGRDVIAVDSVPAGNLCAIYIGDSPLKKAASLSTTLACPSFGQLQSQAAPIVRVAVEPADPSNLNKLVSGLKLLSQVDPVVEVLFQDNGELIISCTGELHLERCIRDLKDTFAKCEFQVSDPIIPFRETISTRPALKLGQNDAFANVKELQTGLVRLETSEFLIEVRCQLIDEAVHCIISSPDVSLDNLAEKLPVSCSWRSSILDKTHKVLAISPRNVRTCVLLCRDSFDESGTGNLTAQFQRLLVDSAKATSSSSPLVPGFELACASGPLCGEPVSGILFVVENFELRAFDSVSDDTEDGSVTALKLTGKLITVFRDVLHACMLTWSPRLALAVYRVKTRASGDVLGKIYAVVSRRKGKVVSEEMKEGTNLFDIVADIPIVESFGLAEELRKRTSGDALPEMEFHGFELLDQDPFWIPTTVEEIEDLGDKADKENLAKRYMETTRKRKGLFVYEKVIEHAEKQKTLKNK